MFHHPRGFYQVTTNILGFSLLLLCSNHFCRSTKTSIRLKSPSLWWGMKKTLVKNAVIKIIEIMIVRTNWMWNKTIRIIRDFIQYLEKENRQMYLKKIKWNERKFESEKKTKWVWKYDFTRKKNRKLIRRRYISKDLYQESYIKVKIQGKSCIKPISNVCFEMWSISRQRSHFRSVTFLIDGSIQLGGRLKIQPSRRNRTFYAWQASTGRKQHWMS